MIEPEASTNNSFDKTYYSDCDGNPANPQTGEFEELYFNEEYYIILFTALYKDRDEKVFISIRENPMFRQINNNSDV